MTLPSPLLNSAVCSIAKHVWVHEHVCVRMVLSVIRLVQGKALTFKSCPLLLGSSNSVSLAITSR